MTLTVGVVDAATGQRIADAAVGIIVHLAGPVASEQPATNGAASFPGLPRGTYSVTATASFAYQGDASVSINIGESTSFEYALRSIDDAIVTEIFVDGQGTIPRGGTIEVPLTGVTLHFRGRYQSPTSPWPAPNSFQANPRAVHITAYSIPFLGPRSPSEWEFVAGNWSPCGDVNGKMECASSSDDLQVFMGTPASRSFPTRELHTRVQPWPLNFRVAAGCCIRPSSLRAHTLPGTFR